MSVKFNNMGQWTLVDGGGNSLIKGWEPPKTAASSRHDATSGKTGADVAAEALSKGVLPHFGPLPKQQPTNEEMFGHLVVTDEMVKAAEEKWEGTFKTLDFRGKIDHLNKSKLDNKAWEYGKSFNQLLSEEEVRERNSYVKDE